MKIVAIDVCPLTGATVDGGWPQGPEPQEDLHTLLIVRTDATAYAETRHRRKIDHVRYRNIARLGADHDGSSQRMLAGALKPRGPR